MHVNVTVCCLATGNASFDSPRIPNQFKAVQPVHISNYSVILPTKQAIEQQKVLHATSEEARRGLEERLQELQQLHGALQRDHAAASEEIARRGELSARLEDKLQKCIEKINLKNEILRKQVQR